MLTFYLQREESLSTFTMRKIWNSYKTTFPYAQQAILNDNKNGPVIHMFFNDGIESTTWKDRLQ